MDAFKTSKPTPIVNLEATEEDLVQHIEALQLPLKRYLAILDDTLCAVRRGIHISTKDQEQENARRLTKKLLKRKQDYITPPKAKPLKTEGSEVDPNKTKEMPGNIPAFGYDPKHSDKQVSD